MKKILIIIGTRPNFIKVTQFKKIARNYSCLDVKIAHTGQHYDKNMADIFFDQFGLQPDYFLNIGSSSPNTQIAKIMLGLESLIEEKYRPDLLIVPGDVNSTLAAALTANKIGIPLAHLESGLRSFDRSMPEEVNRILSDEISDHYFVTEPSGKENLLKENKPGRIHFVGNTMIDTLVAFNQQINESNILEKFDLVEKRYVLMTIHRPGNVDSISDLRKVKRLIISLTDRYKVVFPIHPRTAKRIKDFGLEDEFNNIPNMIKTGPFGYFGFQKLIKNAAFILTDSGGIQEESTYRRIPCLTLRSNTERPITVYGGTNTLVSMDLGEIAGYIMQIEKGTYKTGEIPILWDGQATDRIMNVISKAILND